MADEVVDTVDTGAGEITSVPEAGPAVHGDTATQSDGQADYSKADPSLFSEDQILDWAANQYKAPDPQQQAKPGEVPAQATPQTPPPGQGQQVPQSSVGSDNDFKAALKSLATTHPAVARQVRDEHFTLQAYKDLFPYQDAKSLRGMFSSVAEAKQMQQAAADLLVMDHALVNDPEGLIQHIASRSPEAIQSLAGSFGSALFKTNSDLYRQSLAEPAVKTYLGFWEDQAKQSGNEELKLAIQIVKENEKNYFASQNGDTTKYDKALQSRIQQFEAQEESRRTEHAQQFQSSVSSSYIDKISEDISRMIDRTGATLSDPQKNQIVQTVAGRLGDTFRDDPLLQRRLMLEIKGGAKDQAHFNRIVTHLHGRAQGLLGAYTRDAIETITQQVMNGEANMAPPPQARVNISGGSPPGTQRKMAPTTPYTRQQLRGMSEDQILEAFAE